MRYFPHDSRCVAGAAIVVVAIYRRTVVARA